MARWGHFNTSPLCKIAVGTGRAGRQALTQALGAAGEGALSAPGTLARPLTIEGAPPGSLDLARISEGFATFVSFLVPAGTCRRTDSVSRPAGGDSACRTRHPGRPLFSLALSCVPVVYRSCWSSWPQCCDDSGPTQSTPPLRGQAWKQGRRGRGSQRGVPQVRRQRGSQSRGTRSAQATESSRTALGRRGEK